uniref:Uncharacterized protein n=1 Tax=Anopheles atroparvus TaxID=41427 RepID=A0A182IJR0_ANOAO
MPFRSRVIRHLYSTPWAAGCVTHCSIGPITSPSVSGGPPPPLGGVPEPSTPPGAPFAADFEEMDNGSTSTGVLSSSSLSCDDGSLYGEVGVVVREVVVTFGPVAGSVALVGELGMSWSGLFGDIMNCIGPSYACTSRPFRLTPDIGRTSWRSLACTMPGVARFCRIFWCRLLAVLLTLLLWLVLPLLLLIALMVLARGLPSSSSLFAVWLVVVTGKGCATVPDSRALHAQENPNPEH